MSRRPGVAARQTLCVSRVCVCNYDDGLTECLSQLLDRDTPEGQAMPSVRALASRYLLNRPTLLGDAGRRR